jgi:hypothetical protein
LVVPLRVSAPVRTTGVVLLIAETSLMPEVAATVNALEAVALRENLSVDPDVAKPETGAATT